MTLKRIVSMWSGPGALVLLCMLMLPAGLFAGALTEQAAHTIKRAIESTSSSVETENTADGRSVSRILGTFYRERGFQPVWFTESGPAEGAADVLQALKMAHSEGLRPDFYETRKLETALTALGRSFTERKQPEPAEVAKVDVMLTRALLTYCSDLLAGRVNPASIEGEWSGRAPDVSSLIRKSIVSATVHRNLQSLLPKHEGYFRLRRALSAYRHIAASGGWRPIPEGDELKEGSRGARVAVLKERLAATGDLHTGHADGDDFDAGLTEAVLRFQTRHGLESDGVVGKETLEALNVPVAERIRQIELNMERWRWLPESFGEHYIIVNSADFRLEVHEHGEAILPMRVVVGKPFWHTPSFSALMTHLVLNPSWNVPMNITAEDLVPKIQNDPGYLEEKGYQVLSGWDNDAEEIDPKTIDWRSVTRENISFRLRQKPGPRNPLGRIKFMFPNIHDIYMHDTPVRGLFSLTVRTYSHGCIRIEKPLELADYLLREHPEWTRDEIAAALKKGEERTIRLDHPVLVHLLYWTAWADEDGRVHFREDIYERDGLLEKALFGDEEAGHTRNRDSGT
jgi:murein L,D-transpeptidase YcbB/YkuD